MAIIAQSNSNKKKTAKNNSTAKVSSTKKSTNLADSVSSSINKTQSTAKKTNANKTNKSNTSKNTSSNKSTTTTSKTSNALDSIKTTTSKKTNTVKNNTYTSNAKDSIDKTTKTNASSKSTKPTTTYQSAYSQTMSSLNNNNKQNSPTQKTNTKVVNNAFKNTNTNTNKTLYDVETNEDNWSFKKANQRVKDLKKTSADFESGDAYERFLTKNNFSFSEGNALKYFQDKAKANGTTAREEAQASRIKWNNTLDTEKLETKFRSGQLSDDDVFNINNSFGTLIDLNGNRVDTEQYQKDIETYQKNSESINKDIEKLNKQFESNLITQDNYQLMYKNLENKWNQNEELGNTLRSVSTVQGFDYYDWAKEHGEDVSDFEKYAESFNDSYVERLGEQYSASLVDLVNTPVQVVDMAKSLINKDFDITDENNLSTKLSNQSNELRTYAMAGTSGVENWSIQCISSLMPMMNAMLLGGSIGGALGTTGEALTNFTNTFTNVALGAQTAGQVTRQRVMEGNNNVTAVLNGTVHGVITGLVEGLDAGRVASVFTGTAEKYLAKMSLLGKANPKLIAQFLNSMGASEGAEEIIESVADYFADTIHNDIASALSGDTSSLVNVEKLDAKDLVNQFAMAYVGSVGLGLPTATKITINSKRTYNAVNEAKNFFQSTIESSLATNEEKALAQECIDVINHDMQEYDRKAVLKDAVNRQSDNVGSYGTFDEAMNNLANALRPDIQDATSTATQTMEKATQLKGTMQNALLQKGININSDQYMNLSENARDQVKAISSYAQESGNDVTVLFDTNMDANGSFEVVDGKPVITLNPNSEQAMPITYAHELVHSTEVNTKNYQQLVDLAFPDKTELNKAMNALKNSAYSGADATTLQKEAVAKKISEELLDNNFIDNMAKYNTEIGYKFLYDIRNTINDLKTNSNSLMQIESNLIKALSNQDTFYFEDGVSYSKNVTTNELYKTFMEKVKNKDYTNKDIREYVKDYAEATNDSFTKSIDKILNDEWENPNVRVLVSSESPKWLADLVGTELESGKKLRNLPMLMAKEKVLSILGEGGFHDNQHLVRVETLKNLPALLEDPIAVYEYKHNGKYDGTILAVVEATDKNGDPIIVPINVNGKGRYATIDWNGSTNFVLNMYGKENIETFYDNNLDSNQGGKLLYLKDGIDEKKVKEAILGLQLPNKRLSTSKGIIANQENVVKQMSKSQADRVDDLKNALKTAKEYKIDDKVTNDVELESKVVEAEELRNKFNDYINKLGGKDNFAYEDIKSPEVQNILKRVEEISQSFSSDFNGDTLESYRNTTSFERRQMHRTIIREYYDILTENGTKPKNKIADIVIGPPGAGKSSVVVSNIINKLGSIEVDADNFNSLIPENNFYGGIMANYVHEEASYLSKMMRDILTEQGYNVVLPLVGKNQTSIDKTIDSLVAKGYEVYIRHVGVSPETSVVRVATRFGSTGRYVPVSYAEDIGDSTLKTYEAVKNRKGVTGYENYDNTNGAKLLEQGGKLSNSGKEHRPIIGRSNGELLEKTEGTISQWARQGESNTRGDRRHNSINLERSESNDSFSIANLKQAQSDIIQETNPRDATLGDHLWVNSTEDIKAYAETLLDEGEVITTPDFDEADIQKALETGKMTVYSSYPIEQGNWVTPSRMEASQYAGGGKIYSKEISLTDVAWLNNLEGQYANVNEWSKTNNKQYSKGESLRSLMEENGTGTDSQATASDNTFLNGTDEELNNLNDTEENNFINNQNVQTAEGYANSNFANEETRNTIINDLTGKDGKYSKVTINGIGVVHNKFANEQAIARIAKAGSQQLAITEALTNNRFQEMETTALMCAHLDAQLGEVEQTQEVQNTRYELRKKYMEILNVAGRTVQSRQILDKESPQFQINYVYDVVESLQEDLNEERGAKAPKLEVDEELINKLNEAQTDEERADVRDLITMDIANQIKPIGIKDSVWGFLKTQGRSWRYLSMLGNPRTWIKNRASNFIGGYVADVNRAIQGGLEGLLGEYLKANDSNFEKTAKLANVTKEEKTLFYEIFNERFADEPSKYFANDSISKKSFSQSLKDDILENTKKFGAEWVNKWYEITQKGLSDIPDARKAFTHEIVGRLRANNQTWSDLTQAQQEEYINWAKERATYITLNAPSELATELNRLQRKHGILGELIIGGTLPFKRTNINAGKQMIQYSPVGLGVGLYQTFVEVKQGKIGATQAVQQLSRGLTGTGLVALGAMLASMGLFRTKDDDKDRKQYFDEDNGEQDYALVIPGVGTFTLDWIDPSIAPISIGANVYNWITDYMADGQITKEEGFNILEGLLFANLEPLAETSMLSGLTSTLSSYSSDSLKKLQGVAENILQNYVTSYIPTLSSAIANTIDPIKRNTSNINDNWFTQTWKKAKAKIPGLSMTNEPTIDRNGNEKKAEDMGLGIIGRAILQFGASGRFKENSVDEYDEELYRLYDETGEASAFPSNTIKSFQNDNEKYELTNKEYTQWNKTRWSFENEYVNNFIDSEAYNTFDDSEKIEIIAGLREYAGKVAKAQLLEERGIEYDDSSYQKIKQWFDMDIDDSQKLAIFIANKTIDSAVDENGETITNSKSYAIADAYADAGILEDVFDYIEKYGLDSKDFGINKTVYKKSYKDIAKNYEKIYGEKFGTGYADAYAKVMSGK